MPCDILVAVQRTVHSARVTRWGRSRQLLSLGARGLQPGEVCSLCSKAMACCCQLSPHSPETCSILPAHKPIGRQEFLQLTVSDVRSYERGSWGRKQQFEAKRMRAHLCFVKRVSLHWCVVHPKLQGLVPEEAHRCNRISRVRLNPFAADYLCFLKEPMEERMAWRMRWQLLWN